jgi:REP element-mobilizing transposase RayT
MTLAEDPHQTELRAAGWHSRGYLPHFDGIVIPQFITLHLADSVPKEVIERWKRQLDTRDSASDKMLLLSRIEKYADQGYGEAYLKDHRLAEMVQDTLLKDDGKRYRLSAWVVMPNHVHLLLTRFDKYMLSDIMQSFKSITSHKANKALHRSGQFWMLEYFDRYIRNEKHYKKTVEYIEDNPVKAHSVQTQKTIHSVVPGSGSTHRNKELLTSSWDRGRLARNAPLDSTFILNLIVSTALFALRAHCGRGRPRSQ